MIDFFEVIKRALNGPYFSEQDFTLKVLVPKLRAVIKKYDIRYDRTTLVPSNDQLADDIFQAGLELCAEVGCYCKDTSRVIRFTTEELLEALRDAPSQPFFGEGRDRKAMLARKPESIDPPYCYVGAGGSVVTSEDIYVKLVEGYGRNPLSDSITCPALTKINGMEIVAGSPLELLACIRSVELGRAALRRAQRPGLPIMNSIATGVTATGKIGGSAFGLRDTDCWVVGFTSPLKVQFGRMNEVAYITARGAQLVGEAGEPIGGFAGGPEGNAVISVVYHLLSILVLRASVHLTFPMDIRYGCNTSWEIMWPISIAAQAISRNSHLPLLNLAYTAAGPMTEMCLYEIAATMTNFVASGSNIEFGGVAKGTSLDRMTPLEPRFATEVAHAAAGISRSQANEIVKTLISKYKDNIPDAPKGATFQECFDWDSIQPCQEYIELYGRIKNELTGLGLKFK
jgi:methylamine--corrinoid protein Co-methyltransferase